MVRALCLPLFVLAVACGGSTAPQPAQPAAAPVASNQACECACECEAGRECDCACQCDGAQVATKLTVRVAAAPTARDSGAADGTVTPTEWDGRITRIDDLHYTITRETIDEILANPGDWTRGARIVPSIKDGKPNGFKLYAIRPSSIYAALGIMNGDTLKAINGLPLASPEQALEAYSQLRTQERAELQISRRGQDIVLVIEIE